MNLETISQLTTMYNEPHRHYHDIRHVHFLLRQTLGEECLPLMKHASDVELLNHPLLTAIIWFHDCYYDPYAPAGMNEKYSAAIYDAYARVNNVNDYDRQVVHNAILHSSYHTKDQPITNPLIELFLDLDLLGFYYDYPGTDEDIRKEYWRTSYDEFNKGRIEFLTRLLNRKRIFYCMNDEVEATTRSNIKAKIALYGGENV